MNKMTRETPVNRQAICVFCGSSHGADPIFTQTAQQFGTALAREGFDLVFGGGGVGLMGEVALSVAQGGGKVLGIIPGFLRHLEPPLEVSSSQIVITDSMNERKARMFAAADGFAILPGGIGTLDEFAEVLTGAQLRQHAKPIVVINIKNYFAPLRALLDHFIAQGFAGAGINSLYQVAPTVEDAIKIFKDHRTGMVHADAIRQAGAPSR
jgi:uncharacterized protein (TIGR00730 family)